MFFRGQIDQERAQVSLPNVSVQLAVIHTELPFPAGDSFGSSKRFHGPRH